MPPSHETPPAAAQLIDELRTWLAARSFAVPVEWDTGRSEVIVGTSRAFALERISGDGVSQTLARAQELVEGWWAIWRDDDAYERLAPDARGRLDEYFGPRGTARGPAGGPLSPDCPTLRRDALVSVGFLAGCVLVPAEPIVFWWVPFALATLGHRLGSMLDRGRWDHPSGLTALGLLLGPVAGYQCFILTGRGPGMFGAGFAAILVGLPAGALLGGLSGAVVGRALER